MSPQRFADLVTCVVINLDTRPERWQRTQRLCRLHGITPVRFAAHDKERGAERFPNVEISLGERGLWSSFLEILNTDYKTEWLLIFEDDVLPLPRFRHHIMSEICNVPEDVASIRLGWLGRYWWTPELNYKGNSIRILKAAGRLILARFGKRKLSGTTLCGTHALILRTHDLELIAESLLPVDTPLDLAFVRAEGIWPGKFRLAGRNRAWQWPDKSDIQPRR